MIRSRTVNTIHELAAQGKSVQNIVIITGHQIRPKAVERAIQLSKDRYCGASAMLGKVARITHTFHIVEAAETEVVPTTTPEEI